MLDLQYILENAKQVAANAANRGVSVDVDKIAEFAARRSTLIADGDKLRHEQKETSGEIPQATAEERPVLIARGKELKELIAENEAALRTVEDTLRDEQARVPNMTHPDAPVGGEDDVNVLRTWGEPPQFDFDPKDHVELAENLDLIDFAAGAKVAGSGFYYLKNEAVLLELALVQFAIEQVRAAGFTVFTTPDLARDEVLSGIGFAPRGPEAQIYSVEDTDLSLVATAEITLGGALKDEIIDVGKLPMRHAGLSHCFRTEAGSHGKATRGIYRVHQFTKVEMFGFTEPTSEASDAFLDTVVDLEERIFQALGLHYQVIDTPTGDLGGPAYRKFDLEAWMPGRGGFGEVTSASNCTDYQARRLNIRCKEAGKKGTRFVHTLNGTAISVARAIVAILENYQQADGSVIVPEVLRKWVGCDRISRPTS